MNVTKKLGLVHSLYLRDRVQGTGIGLVYTDYMGLYREATIRRSLFAQYSSQESKEGGSDGQEVCRHCRHTVCSSQHSATVLPLAPKFNKN